MGIQKHIAALCGLAGVALFPHEATAFSSKDIEVLARTLPFVEGIDVSNVKVAVVFDPANADSKAQADAVVGELGGGKTVGKATLTATAVPVSDSAGITSSDIIIVADALDANAQASIFGAASGANKITVSSNFGCVEAAQCVMGVRSQPSVQITVNADAAKSSGIGFAQALRMMIQEI